MERLGWKNLSTADRYLVRRERIHKEYESLHEYWIGFKKCWTPKEDVNADNHGGADAAVEK
jgi:hypothetical protein